jgi:hypothetical protein
MRTYRSPVMQVDRLPIGVIPWIKCTTVLVEFVREHQLPFLSIQIGRLRISFSWSVLVNEAKVSREIGDLARRVDSAEVEAPLIRQSGLREVGNDGVT